jgi:endonuclease YncB( thermonuclease family)
MCERTQLYLAPVWRRVVGSVARFLRSSNALSGDMLWRLWFVALAFACHGVAAETIVGRVVGVSDGDTITILDAKKQQHTIRLNGIDAPERSQPFTHVSKESLSELTFQKAVAVEYRKRDRYGRLVGKVVVADRDVCLEQIRRGMAWYYRVYEADVSPADRPLYEKAEEQARNDRVGLWGGYRPPVPPWEYRDAIRRKKEAVVPAVR